MVICYTCQEEITFDKNIKSQTGKPIPLWPDKQNTHSHDEDGNPVRKPLPQTQQLHKVPQINQYKREPGTPTDIPKTSQGGLPLDTKRLLQTVVELTKEVRELRQETQQNHQEIKTMVQEATIVDTSRYENHMSWLYDKIPEDQKNKDWKSAKEYHDQLNTKPSEIDTVTRNHSKIAEDKQNFMQRKRDRIHDESKEKTLDERIPDNDDEFAVSQSLKEDDEGVIDEE